MTSVINCNLKVYKSLFESTSSKWILFKKISIGFQTIIFEVTEQTILLQALKWTNNC